MTTLPISLIDGDTLHIDNSSLEVFTTCPRSAEYYFCHKKRASGERSALKFGQIIHKALDARYRAVSPQHAQTEEVQSAMLQILDQEFAGWSPSEDDFRTYSFAVELVLKYGLAYPFESFSIAKLPDGSPFVEVPFALPLGTIEVNDTLLVRSVETGTIGPRFVKTLNVVWTGKIDLGYESDKRTYILDHKTTSMMGPGFFADFELSNAMRGYVWAAEQILGKPVAGFVINALATRKPTKTGVALQFERKLFPVDRWSIDEWKVNVMYIIADFVEMVRRGVLPQHTKWCVGKYGECPYRKVCTLPPEQRPLMLSTGEFTNVTWNPLDSTA